MQNQIIFKNLFLQKSIIQKNKVDAQEVYYFNFRVIVLDKECFDHNLN